MNSKRIPVGKVASVSAQICFLMITGGYNGGNLASSELISADGTVETGPDLPVGRYGHWMVTLHDGRVMIIGAGDPSSLRQNVLIYDSSTNTFTAGPDTIYSVLQSYVLHIAVRIGKLRACQQ